ncbi:MAG: hypothetical protein AAB431_01195 [Patescibacteria group bacterium]
MYVIEFLGMARAGKTTQIDKLRTFLESKGKRVGILTDRERALTVQTPVSEGLAYTLVFFSLAIDAHEAHKNKVDYLLIDRGFHDVAVWADVRFHLGEISQTERDALKMIFERFLDSVHRTFYFTLPVDVALQRHTQTTQQAVDDVAMNKKWLELLAESYKNNESHFTNVTHLDGACSAEEIHEQIIRSLGEDL